MPEKKVPGCRPFPTPMNKLPTADSKLARIYVMVGRFDAAVEIIQHLLSVPGELPVPLLKIDPAWDPLRDHPRFQKLVE